MPEGRTAAFGDGLNDLEMLAWATYGVAMGDAVVEVQDAADEVTLTAHEDGVARVLDRWFPMSEGDEIPTEAGTR